MLAVLGHCLADIVNTISKVGNIRLNRMINNINEIIFISCCIFLFTYLRFKWGCHILDSSFIGRNYIYIHYYILV